MDKLMTQPLFSLICPFFNSISTLGRLLRSIINQSFCNWELILVDDNSNDNYQNILCLFDDKRIKVIKNDKNIGPFKSRINGIKCSKGQYLWFVDADDELINNSLELLHKYIINYSFPSIVFFGINMIENNNIIRFSRHDKNATFYDNVYDIAKVLMVDEKGFHSLFSKIFKRDSYTPLDYPCAIGNLISREDYVFHLSFLDKAKTLLVIDDYLYNYYHSTDPSISRSANSFKPEVKISSLYIAKSFIYHRLLELGVYSDAIDNIFSYNLAIEFLNLIVGLAKTNDFTRLKDIKNDCFNNVLYNLCNRQLKLKEKIYVFLFKYNIRVFHLYCTRKKFVKS